MLCVIWCTALHQGMDSCSLCYWSTSWRPTALAWLQTLWECWSWHQYRNVLENHLRYLSDELVGLSLFSDNVSSAVKSAIVKGLIWEPGKRNIHGDSSILAKPDVSLGDIATTRTASLLCCHDPDNTFLALPPEQWPPVNRICLDKHDWSGCVL